MAATVAEQAVTLLGRIPEAEVEAAIDLAEAAVMKAITNDPAPMVGEEAEAAAAVEAAVGAAVVAAVAEVVGQHLKTRPFTKNDSLAMRISMNNTIARRSGGSRPTFLPTR